MPGQVWTAGPFRGYPCSPEEEALLIEQAAAACPPDGARKRPHRTDVTTLIVALRDGATYEELCQFLPGLDPARLVAAYRLLDRRRQEAVTAWHEITENPGAVSITHAADKAARVLPVPVAEVVRVASTAHNLESINHVVAVVAHKVETETLYTQEVEADLHENQHSLARRMRIGAELFQPQHQCLWSAPFYLPRRITDLSPLRVMDLLGERLSS